MTLDEAKIEFEKDKTVWSADKYYRWARFRKTNDGCQWPLSRAPTGELFLAMCSGGEKLEAKIFPATYKTKELAIEAWFRCVSGMGHRIENPVVYWRQEPGLEKITGGWVVYSRLIVSTEIEK